MGGPGLRFLSLTAAGTTAAGAPPFESTTGRFFPTRHSLSLSFQEIFFPDSVVLAVGSVPCDPKRKE